MVDDRIACDGVVTLSELMQRYRMDYLSIALLSCQTLIRDMGYMDSLGLPFKEGVMPAVGKMVGLLGVCIKHADGDGSLVLQIEALEKQLVSGSEKRISVIDASLQQIMVGVEHVLSTRSFMFLPADQAKYWLNMEQFGDSVGMFPDAMPDMLEMSNCYAAGRSTACIFHSMRVAEHGLRHIAKQLKVSLKDKGQQMPIEYATWERVLVAIKNKRESVRQLPKSTKQANMTVEYAAIGEHMSHLKDLWRNPIMHSRKTYSMVEALGVMDRVSELMRLISGNRYAPSVDGRTLKETRAFVSEMKNLGSGK